MSLRVRLVLIILLSAILPAVLAVGLTAGYAAVRSTRMAQGAITLIGETNIHDQATTTAQQIESYLREHPEVGLDDVEALQADPTLAMLAVQPVGKTGYTAVYDGDAVTHFHPNPAIIGVSLSTLAEPYPEFWAIVERSLLEGVANGYYDWPDADDVVRLKYMAVAPVGGTGLWVAATTYMEEFAAPAEGISREVEALTRETGLRAVLSIIVAALISLALGSFISIRTTMPLREMAVAATRVMQGEWQAVRPLQRQDEIGTLSRALYAMTHRLQGLVEELEDQVAERTEQLARRARYLQATSEVARDAASVLDEDSLLDHVVSLVAERFGFYHVALYLVEASGEQVGLRAALGAGERQMLQPGHRLALSGPGAIERAARLGQYCIVLDTDSVAVPFDLPETRSQIVLPLRVRGDTIGVLDVQSRELEAFSDEDVAALQALAEQIAVAIHNARLFDQAQESAEAERRARGELGASGWRALLGSQPELGFRSTKEETVPSGDLWRSAMEMALQTGQATVDESDRTRLAIPIRAGGRVIGVVEGRKPEGQGKWTEDEVEMLGALTDQLSQAVERARLYRETQRGAARERTIAEVGARVRASLDLETMLRTAATEMRQALNLGDLVVRLAPPEAGGGPEGVGQ